MEIACKYYAQIDTESESIVGACRWYEGIYLSIIFTRYFHIVIPSGVREVVRGPSPTEVR